MIVTLLLGLAGILGSTAAMMGAEHISQRISADKNKKNGLTPDDIVRTIKELTAYARNKGAQAINLLNNRLAAISLPLGASPAVKDAVIDARRQLNSQIKTANDDYAKLDAKVSNVEERASNLALQPETYRRYYGTNQYNNIKQDANDAVKEMSNFAENISNLSKGVENNV